MSNRRRLKKTLPLLGLMLFLSACSIEIPLATPNAAPTRLPATLTITPAPTSSLMPEAASATPWAVPVSWANIHLTGRLIFTAGTQGIGQLDLASGKMTQLFLPPDQNNAWVLSQSVSPDDRQIVMAYAPPPAAGQIQFGYTDLYLIPLDGSGAPQAAIAHTNLKESYSNAVWSPDGKYIYYSHSTTTVDKNGQVSGFKNAIERLAYPGGQPERMMDNAIWPRLSPDGSKLVYVGVTPAAANQLYVARPDGKNPVRLALPRAFLAVDAPVFSPDNQTIVFSAITADDSLGLSWLDRLLGVRLASADGSPADWWRIPVTGGQPERLTDISDTSLYGVFSPDGQYFAYICGSGLYVMPSPKLRVRAQPDEVRIALLLDANAMPGSIGSATIAWIP